MRARTIALAVLLTALALTIGPGAAQAQSPQQPAPQASTKAPPAPPAAPPVQAETKPVVPSQPITVTVTPPPAQPQTFQLTMTAVPSSPAPPAQPVTAAPMPAQVVYPGLFRTLVGNLGELLARQKMARVYVPIAPVSTAAFTLPPIQGLPSLPALPSPQCTMGGKLSSLLMKFGL